MLILMLGIDLLIRLECVLLGDNVSCFYVQKKSLTVDCTSLPGLLKEREREGVCVRVC